MKYPKEVQQRIDVLNTYTEVDKMDKFDIMHLYPTRLAYPNGYYDSMFFNLILFNTETMKKQNVGRHDAVFVNRYADAYGKNIVEAVLFKFMPMAVR